MILVPYVLEMLDAINSSSGFTSAETDLRAHARNLLGQLKVSIDLISELVKCTP